MVDKHEIFMRRCLDLAAKGFGHVAPNPMVGSVIVCQGEIIGEGYHQQFGKEHAEVNAVNSVLAHKRHLVKEADLYVSLEPCAHLGKTPPCADMIIENRISRVIIASNDPNPQVAGKGIQKLKDAGVEVITGVLQQEADFLNRRFMTFFIKHRPYIILKWAQSADGFIAPHEPRQFWLTNEYSKKLVHQWRAQEQAIMAGRRTVEADDPELTVRLVEGHNPARVIIDRNLSLPVSSKVFTHNARVFVFNEKKQGVEDWIHFTQIDFSQNVLLQIFTTLASANIQSLIVEGGPETLHHFIEQHLWDESRIFISPIKMGAGRKAPLFTGKLVSEEDIRGDILKMMLNPRL